MNSCEYIKLCNLNFMNIFLPLYFSYETIKKISFQVSYLFLIYLFIHLNNT